MVGEHESMSSVARRPESSAAAARPRPLEQIFPLRGDANRGREMQATWRSFCRDRSPAVKTVLAAGRSPPEIAYQLGELLHNHFRTRGVTLTSYELRRLVAELLALHGPPGQADKGEATSIAGNDATVAFDGELAEDPWPAGDVVRKSAPHGPERPPPPLSPSAAATPREAAPFAQLLTRALELVGARLVSRDRQAARAAVDEAVNSVAGEQGGELPAATRERLVASALSEVVGLGLIDRLWSDPTVRAILINGPSSVFVDRDGTLQAVPESFRDGAHLLELMDRLVARPASGIADLRLRDGSNGVVIFPPVAPAGPVLILRRAQPGEATLERMVAGGLLDRAVADLLRLGARSRLNMLVIGPPGSGKTAVLAAVTRDLDAAVRVVTVARHRQFRWPASMKVELAVSPAAPFSTLIEAGDRLEPALLVLDAVQREDVAALSGRLLRGGSGTLASLAPDAMSAELARAADLVVRIDRVGDGPFRVVAVEDSLGAVVFRRDGDRLVRGTATPSFAAVVQARGHGDALAQLMR
jgi:type IV secretory pathway ATPase VirB11/archaellum biosynthesis ATPase